jgi:hypothetical protein
MEMSKEGLDVVASQWTLSHRSKILCISIATRFKHACTREGRIFVDVIVPRNTMMVKKVDLTSLGFLQ